MTQGFFICRGDKTTCGGQVLDGDARINMFGLLHARMGDRVSCGKDGKIYQIVGGISYMISHGKPIAGTLDSRSGCPCNAELIPSSHGACYHKATPTPLAMRSFAESQSSAMGSTSTVPRQFAFVPQTSLAAPLVRDDEPQEPGFHIVTKSMSREALEATLFPQPDPAVMRKFTALNPGVSDLKAGSMIVLSDPRNHLCMREEALLMEAAAKANEALTLITVEEADFMMRHRAELETFLAHGSTAIGIGETMFAKHLDNVKNVLRDIETLHQKTFQKDGHLRSPEFFAERKRLLSLLDISLNGITRKSIGFADHPHLKHALGIYNKSLIHKWTEAGAPGQIPGYATHIEGVSRAAKFVKYGGWVGTAIGGGASYMKVQDVCAAGNVEACRKVKFTETGNFVGGLAVGAAVGAAVTAPIAGAVCLALGVPTAGIAPLACGLVVVGVASYAGGAAGAASGEALGEIIFEALQ